MVCIRLGLAVGCLLLATARAQAQCSLQPLAAVAAAQPGEEFGGVIALQGDELLVGATGLIDGPPDYGHVDLFRHEGGAWVSAGKLEPPDGALGRRFGNALALQDDRLVVGASSAYVDGTLQGAAYVFERQAGAWTPVVKLSASDGEKFDGFGSSVALDGDCIVVGADNAGPGFGNGAAYVFELGPRGWSEVARLKPATSPSIDGFGQGCAVSGDTIVVGNHGSNSKSGPGGRAYVFTRATDGSWPQTQLLQGSHPHGDYFGWKVVMEGDELVIGAHLEEVPGIGYFGGAVYAFERQGTTLVPTQRIDSADSQLVEAFGSSLALDGERLAIGSASGGGTFSGPPGAAAVFTRWAGQWTRVLVLEPPPTLQNPHSFGNAIALDGARLVVGADGEPVPVQDSGEVYAYTLGVLHAPYGQGLAGQGGFVPLLLGATCAAGGSHAVQLELRAGLGGAPCALLFGVLSGVLPFAGGVVQVAPPWRLFPLVLGGAAGVSGAGQFSLAASLPPSVVLPALFAQLIVVDAAGPAGFALSLGLQLPSVP